MYENSVEEKIPDHTCHGSIECMSNGEELTGKRFNVLRGRVRIGKLEVLLPCPLLGSLDSFLHPQV